MSEMTKEEIEDVWSWVYRMYVGSVPNIYPASVKKLRVPFDLALRALSLESVREEALEEATFSVHHDFDLERITLAMVQAVDDEYARNEKLRLAYAHDVEYRRRTIAAVHQRLLNGWIDLVIKPLLAKYHRHFQSVQRIVEREALQSPARVAEETDAHSTELRK